MIYRIGLQIQDMTGLHSSGKSLYWGGGFTLSLKKSSFDFGLS